jgi:oligopeptidase B
MGKSEKTPRARVSPFRFRRHGIAVEDPYAWLKDKAYPKLKSKRILRYLEAENAYTRAWFRPRQRRVEALFREMKGRIPAADAAVPVRDGPYFYGSRFKKGAQYRVWTRRKGARGREAVLLDENARARGKKYYALGALQVSPDHRLLAFSEDASGSETFTLRVKDLRSGKMLRDVIPNTIEGPEWAADSRSFFYLDLNKEWRPFRVRRHVLGQDVAKDAIVYQEKDPRFFVSLGKSQSRKYIFIASGDYLASETRFVPAAEPEAKPALIAKRRKKHRYGVDHAAGRFFILTNDRHKNFRLVSAPEERPSPRHWKQLLAPSQRRYLKSLMAFKTFLALKEKRDGLDRIRVLPYRGKPFEVAFPDPVYSASLGTTPEYDTKVFRLTYESPVTPRTVNDFDVRVRRLKRRKVQKIPSGFNRRKYETGRVMVKARDGARVPLTLLYAKASKKRLPSPVHLYGYGAYGLGLSPHFSTVALSLVDRGFVYAVAHVRGGDEIGFAWVEGGKRWKRKNTFHDFIDCARYLIQKGIAAEGGISIEGGSAGGSLIGYAVNNAPRLWRAAVLAVPFVDVLNTMLDARLPLTPIEWGEWGNPLKSKRAFAFIKSWSPYDNIKRQAYPPMLVTGGLNDPRVTYWEPAKWVARVRANSTSGNVVLLKTNMGAGHRGKSGRFARLREAAEEYAFLLAAFGKP